MSLAQAYDNLLAQTNNQQKEIDRLTAQLAKTEKALKDTIRIYLVDDEEWDPKAKTLKIFDRIMKEVE